MPGPRPLATLCRRADDLDMTIRAATRILARYPLVILVLVGGLLAGVFAFAGVEPAARWTATAVAAVVALAQVVNMVRDARAGRWGLDVLAVLAIGSTAVLGDYWASLIVALMMAGGEALEDYASHRARGQLSALLSRVPRRARRIGSPLFGASPVRVFTFVRR